MKNLQKILSSIIIVVLFLQCNNDQVQIADVVKFSETDQFRETISKSQNFTLDANADNVIEGESGTIIILPKGCFRNSKNEIVTTEIKLELAEALSIEEMLLSNLTTTSNGKPLITDGMIYVNATQNGEQLVIDKENPIHIEIPTDKKIPGMMVYRGVRDEIGEMNWIEPKELKNYLVPVDLSMLDFLPEGFEEQLINTSPLPKYKNATQDVIDSLYYSLSNSLRESREVKDESAKGQLLGSGICGVDPVAVKIIKGEEYQNTLISTREFEQRLQVIFKTCDNYILEIYIKNIDRDLWELDSLASVSSNAIGAYSESHEFEDFGKQKLTNIKDSSRYSKLLGNFYEQRIAKVRSELRNTRDLLRKELEEKKKITKEMKLKYDKLLKEREVYQKETYGFEIRQAGWVNIDKGVLSEDWSSQNLEMFVEGGKYFDRVHTYVVMTSARSLSKLKTLDQESFYVGSNVRKEMFMPNTETAVAVCFAYKDAVPYFAMKGIEIGTDYKINLLPKKSSVDAIKEAIKPLDNVERENRLSVDLDFMKALYREEVRDKALKLEDKFINKLYSFVNPCCDEM